MNDEVGRILPALSVEANDANDSAGTNSNGSIRLKEAETIPNEPTDRPTDSWIKTAIEQHEDALLRYAQHFVFDIETARDVVQDTFLKLCRQSEKSEDGLKEIRQRLAPWLFTVCRNRAIDVGRKERRMKLASENQLDGQSGSSNNLANQKIDLSEPSAAMERSESAAGLMRQVATLPDRQQEVLRLKFHAGLSYKEIAEVTGLTSSNVGFVLHTAISKLRQKMT